MEALGLGIQCVPVRVLKTNEQAEQGIAAGIILADCVIAIVAFSSTSNAMYRRGIRRQLTSVKMLLRVCAMDSTETISENSKGKIRNFELDTLQLHTKPGGKEKSLQIRW